MDEVERGEARPLAWRMRPRTLDEFVGQEHLLGPGKLLRRLIEADRVSSLILFGPPGCGKSALARLIAATSRALFREINAVTAGVADIRQVHAEAEKEGKSGRKSLLLVDEIHRFNRSQQSALLPDVEKGVVTFIGTSTQNPFFAIIPALSSRSQLLEMKPLAPEHLIALIRRALLDPDRGFGKLKVRLAPDAEAFIAQRSEGDARRALNALEVAVKTTPCQPDGSVQIGLDVAEESIGKKAVIYDPGDPHYDTISAFIKSLRGSDPDAAIYWLAKMLYAGEDPIYIARRLMILAAEDIGCADPRALPLAVSALQALQAIGLPEGKIPLAEATIYLAMAPKSNAAYMALCEAEEEIRSAPVREVPGALKDAHYQGAKRLGRGEGYIYPHDLPGHWVDQEYGAVGRVYYRPSDQGEERLMAERLQRFRRLMQEGTGEGERS